MTKTINADRPKISVITPSFNQGRFLEKTIRSILDQEYSNLEYIIVDGGSTDGSIPTIRKYESHLAYWESTPDGGQYDAIQKGFNRSSGEIMAYLNSDDLYFPWTLQVVGEIFAAFPEVEWLTTSCISATPPEAQFPLIFNRYNRSRRRFFETRGKLLRQRDFLQQEATFWRRSLWEKAGVRLDTSLKYAGDFELWSRFYEHTSPVTVHIPLAMFRIHNEQKTESLDQYIAEAETVLAKYPRPFWIPPLLLRCASLIYRRLQLDVNWFDARSDYVEYRVRQAEWVYQKKLQWQD
jgi:glycosyltransferase involved in cell wall biosynthesis